MMPAPILTRQEIQALFDSFSPTRAVDVRDKALLWLAYRHSVKMVQLLTLDVSDYDRSRGRLRIAARPAIPAREIELDAVARELLQNWLTVRRELNIPAFALLFCATAAGSLGHRLGAPQLREKLTRKGKELGIHSRVTLEGLRVSGKRHVHVEDLGLGSRVFADVDRPDFKGRHPASYVKWADADGLFQLDPVRHATRIGHDCREAICLFSDELLRLHDVNAPKGAGTEIKVRVVLEAAVTSKTVRSFLDALVQYWRKLCDLCQRQEHDSKREGEPLTASDSRRVVFHTLLVMYEIDAAIDSGPSGPGPRWGPSDH